MRKLRNDGNRFDCDEYMTLILRWLSDIHTEGKTYDGFMEWRYMSYFEPRNTKNEKKVLSYGFWEEYYDQELDSIEEYWEEDYQLVFYGRSEIVMYIERIIRRANDLFSDCN